MTKVLAKTLIPAAAIATLVSVGTSALTLSKDLREIEIHFYDKEDKAKKIKISLGDKVSDWGKLRVQKQENSNDFKSLSDVSDKNEKGMWKTLWDIGNKYVLVQHKLNLIRNSIDKAKEPDCGTNGKCCCTDAAGQNCNCTKGQCCARCICCYANTAAGAPSQDCCCKNAGDNCKWDDFKKIQNTFKYLMPNLDGGTRNIYIQPVQAHIKLSSVSFDDLKVEEGASSTTEAQESFDGTLVYGFVDYNYKPTKYKDLLPKNKASEYTDLNEQVGKDLYFANVPQTFSFKYKKSNSSSGGSSVSEKKNDIGTVHKSLDDDTKVKNQMDTYTKQEYKHCCDNENDVVKCLVTRNYIFLEKEKLDGIQTKIKNTGKCNACST